MNWLDRQIKRLCIVACCAMLSAAIFYDADERRQMHEQAAKTFKLVSDESICRQQLAGTIPASWVRR
jgi:hypothetical protein